MASVRKRKDSKGNLSYHVQVRLKGYPTQTASFDRLTDARKWASSTESAIREGRHFKTAESKKHTLADLIDRYIENIIPHKKNQKNDLRHLQYWKDEIGAYALSEVTSSLIVEARDKLKSPNRSNSTINRYMTSLSHSLSIGANEWEWIENNPCRKIRKLKEPRGRIRYLSEAEKSRLLKNCSESNSKDLYDAVVLSLATGARYSELMGLNWNQVDFQRKAITLFETKNNEIRLLPIVGLAYKIIEQRFIKRRFDTELIFPSQKDKDKPIEIRDSFEKACRDSEIKDFKWHDLRHTTASYLAMNGASLAEIAEVLGHKTLAMVKRYAHLSEAHTAKVVESMNEKMFKGA
jgi:integrase